MDVEKVSPCFICSCPGSYNLEYDWGSQWLEKVMTKVCRSLLVPRLGLDPGTGWVCSGCFPGLEKVAELSRKVEVLSLEITSTVERLGRRVLLASAEVKKGGASKDRVWKRFKQPVIQNFVVGKLPNPSVKIDSGLVIPEQRQEEEREEESREVKVEVGGVLGLSGLKHKREKNKGDLKYTERIQDSRTRINYLLLGDKNANTSTSATATALGDKDEDEANNKFGSDGSEISDETNLDELFIAKVVMKKKEVKKMHLEEMGKKILNVPQEPEEPEPKRLVIPTIRPPKRGRPCKIPEPEPTGVVKPAICSPRRGRPCKTVEQVVIKTEPREVIRPVVSPSVRLHRLKIKPRGTKDDNDDGNDDRKGDDDLEVVTTPVTVRQSLQNGKGNHTDPYPPGPVRRELRKSEVRKELPPPPPSSPIGKSPKTGTKRKCDVDEEKVVQVEVEQKKKGGRPSKSTSGTSPKKGKLSRKMPSFKMRYTIPHSPLYRTSTPTPTMPTPTTPLPTPTTPMPTPLEKDEQIETERNFVQCPAPNCKVKFDIQNINKNVKNKAAGPAEEIVSHYFSNHINLAAKLSKSKHAFKCKSCDYTCKLMVKELFKAQTDVVAGHRMAIHYLEQHEDGVSQLFDKGKGNSKTGENVNSVVDANTKSRFQSNGIVSKPNVAATIPKINIPKNGLHNVAEKANKTSSPSSIQQENLPSVQTDEVMNFKSPSKLKLASKTKARGKGPKSRSRKEASPKRKSPKTMLPKPQTEVLSVAQIQAQTQVQRLIPQTKELQLSRRESLRKSLRNQVQNDMLKKSEQVEGKDGQSNPSKEATPTPTRTPIRAKPGPKSKTKKIKLAEHDASSPSGPNSVESSAALAVKLPNCNGLQRPGPKSKKAYKSQEQLQHGSHDTTDRPSKTRTPNVIPALDQEKEMNTIIQVKTESKDKSMDEDSIDVTLSEDDDYETKSSIFLKRRSKTLSKEVVNTVDEIDECLPRPPVIASALTSLLRSKSSTKVQSSPKVQFTPSPAIAERNNATVVNLNLISSINALSKPIKRTAATASQAVSSISTASTLPIPTPTQTLIETHSQVDTEAEMQGQLTLIPISRISATPTPTPTSPDTFRCPTCNIPWFDGYEAFLDHLWSHKTTSEQKMMLTTPVGTDIPKSIREELILQGRSPSTFSFSNELVAELIMYDPNAQTQEPELTGNDSALVVPNTSNAVAEASRLYRVEMEDTSSGLKKWFKCRQCNHSVPAVEGVRNKEAEIKVIVHFLQDHFDRSHICQICAQGFSEGQFLTNHVYSHFPSLQNRTLNVTQDEILRLLQ